MTKRIFTAILAVAALLLPYSADAAKSSAAQVVSAVSKAITGAPSVDARFTLRQQGRQPVSGSACIQGQKFTLTLPEMRVWFDGKTQWTYSKEAGEVNVTEPSAEELAETNPLSIITSSAKGCKARRLDAAKGTDRIELTPPPGSSFSKAVVTSDASTNFIREISVTMNDGSRATITFDSMKKVAAKPEAFFRFDKKLIPSARIVDLR